MQLFEHMKNYELLMAKISRALKPGWKLFVHIFRTQDYLRFEHGVDEQAFLLLGNHAFSGFAAVLSEGSEAANSMVGFREALCYDV